MRSRWFTVDELTSKHPLAQPYPVHWYEDRARPLLELLDVVRDEVGGPVTITPNGGYRCREHNAAVGGKTRSQHLQGRAADIKAKGWTPARLHALVLALWQAGRLPRLGGLGLYSWGVHVDIRPRGKSARLAQWGATKGGQVA